MLKLICQFLRSVVIGGTLFLTGCCAMAPYSFRLDSAETLNNRIIYPPGAVKNADGQYDIFVETDVLTCRDLLPKVSDEDGIITFSNPYWPAIGSRVVRLQIKNGAEGKGLKLPLTARCSNVDLRHPSQATDGIECAQDWLASRFWQTVEHNENWKACLKGRAEAEPKFLEDLAQVLPNNAANSGAILEERTFYPNDETLEFVKLPPESVVCIRRDHLIRQDNAANRDLWVSAPDMCQPFLYSEGYPGATVLSRTDRKEMFPFASEWFQKQEGAISEVRSWLPVRGVLSMLMKEGAFLYVYYPPKPNILPHKDNWGPDEANDSRPFRVYPSSTVESPRWISPVLVVQKKALKLENSPSIEELCNPKDQGRCFAFRDVNSIDVFFQLLVDGRAVQVTSGSLTTDVPEVMAATEIKGLRRFRHRMVPLEFDFRSHDSAIPLSRGDQFWRDSSDQQWSER